MSCSIVISNIRLFTSNGIDVMSYNCFSGGVRKQKSLVDVHNKLKNQIENRKVKYSRER